jgi:hypothetical protein
MCGHSTVRDLRAMPLVGGDLDRDRDRPRRARLARPRAEVRNRAQPAQPTARGCPDRAPRPSHGSAADRGTWRAICPGMQLRPSGRATSGGESHKQRVDRELHELLEEIRVALPGVELLFGFLLILPFSERFEVLGEPQRAIYLVCLLATAAATALFIAPSAQHRVGFRALNKERLLIRMNRRVIAGLILVAVAISLATTLIGWIVFAPTWAMAIGLGTASWFIAWWFLVPPFWRSERTLRDEMSSPDGAADPDIEGVRDA